MIGNWIFTILPDDGANSGVLGGEFPCNIVQAFSDVSETVRSDAAKVEAATGLMMAAQ